MTNKQHAWQRYASGNLSLVRVRHPGHACHIARARSLLRGYNLDNRTVEQLPLMAVASASYFYQEKLLTFSFNENLTSPSWRQSFYNTVTVLQCILDNVFVWCSKQNDGRMLILCECIKIVST